MSFDLTFWCRGVEPVDAAGVHAWFAADRRFEVDRSWPADVYTVGFVGPAHGYAVFDVERYDLEEFDEDDPEGPVTMPGHSYAGIRFELSYAAPAPAADQAFAGVADMAAALHLAVFDEQADALVRPDERGDLLTSWSEATRIARDLLGQTPT